MLKPLVATNPESAERARSLPRPMGLRGSSEQRWGLEKWLFCVADQLLGQGPIALTGDLSLDHRTAQSPWIPWPRGPQLHSKVSALSP